jgi:hypothetical protein
MFLGLSYWDILYHIIVIAVLLSEIARKAGIEAARLERHSPAGDASATAAP